MAKAAEFYPPEMKPVLVRLAQSVSPLVGRLRYQMVLSVSPESVDRLRSLRGYPLLLTPNHPTFHDGMAMFLLAARVGELFNFLVAYESFQGTKAKLLQGLGAYSVRRGMGDRSSIAQTLDILSRPNCRLVVFPEGGCSFQNDTVMPFRSGAIQVAFQSMNRCVRKGEPVPDLYVVPISLKYRYLGAMDEVIHRSLSRLERALHLSVSHHSDPEKFYDRLGVVADRVLLTFERDYDLNGTDFNGDTVSISRGDRINRIKSHVLTTCEQALGLTPSPTDPLRERVYRIQHTIELREEAEIEHRWNAEKLQQAASRLLNFDAIYDGYVAANPTPERFLDTLTRLERAVFSIDQPPPKGERQVIIHVGEPINLKDSFEEFQQDRPATIDRLTRQINDTVQKNLDWINAQWQ